MENYYYSSSSEQLSKSTALIACGSMAILYVAILYSPTLLFRLPKPTSLNTFMIRRFICAIISSLVSVTLSAFLLPIKSWDVGAYGIRVDHMCQAVLIPLSLTSLVYTGSLFSKVKSFQCTGNVSQRLFNLIVSVTYDVLAWRNYVVAPLTEELVFRACMIPLLLCGGFKTYTIIFLSPVFFSLGNLYNSFRYFTRVGKQYIS
ncbi:hypothetical protein IFM89_036868 [Coptis chinensis]|uniref:intramembrane prenyl-peptidase Rce1 n=1 Tax=Coptis chinensis TaxID=261450 RepID=A0A835HJB4_9MAGN|nr:hypothetical protein IFM89_036868 [Coptis chinensis]